MLTIYKRFFQNAWAQTWQYRANYLLSMFYLFVTPTISLSVWVSIARANGTVGGFGADEFIAYYLLIMLVNVITSEGIVYQFAWKVESGALSDELLLPVHPMLTNVLIGQICGKLMNFVCVAPIFVALMLIFQPVITTTPGAVALGALASLTGAVVYFLFGTIIAMLAFWTTRVYWIAELFGFALWRMLSGEFVPLALLPGPIRVIAEVLPYHLGLYFPVQIIMNKLAPDEIARGFALQALWTVILALVFRLQWRAGLRRYSAVGA
jgi:ABC-2 type transport system permease protein